MDSKEASDSKVESKEDKKENKENSSNMGWIWFLIIPREFSVETEKHKFRRF